MSSLTMRHAGAHAALEAASGRLSAFLWRLIEARESQARRRTAAYLASCTDERLRGLGLGNEAIRAIRAGAFNGVRG